MKDLLNKVFESEFSEIFQPMSAEQALKGKWQYMSGFGWTEDSYEWITSYLGDSGEVVWMSPEDFGYDIYKQLGDFLSSYAKEDFYQPDDTSILYNTNVKGIDVITLEDGEELQEIMVAEIQKDELVDNFLEWRKVNE